MAFAILDVPSLTTPSRRTHAGSLALVIPPSPQPPQSLLHTLAPGHEDMSAFKAHAWHLSFLTCAF